MRYRFSDLKRTTGGAGHAPFKADMLGYDNYYPFGMMPEDRRATALTGGIGRYGYNGKEMDNEFNDRNGAGDGTANSYDYGFRMYEPRLGKFLSEDPLTGEYPGWSPYAYAMNRVIDGVDLDGRLVIFVNGFRLGPVFDPTDWGGWPSNNEAKRGYQSIYRNDQLDYWDNMDELFMNRIGDFNAAYFDASNYANSTAQERRNIGQIAGRSLIAKLRSGEISLKPGETIKMVLHSQGVAFGEGIADVLSDPKETAGLAVVPNIEVIYAVAPKQPEDIVDCNCADRVVQYSSQDDFIAPQDPMPGASERVEYSNSIRFSLPWSESTIVNDILNAGLNLVMNVPAVFVDPKSSIYVPVRSGGGHTIMSYQRIFDIKSDEKGYVAPRKDEP